MSIDCYIDVANQIKENLPSDKSYAMCCGLLEIFVQDCSLMIHQPHFGNVTKRKARILFDLQTFLTTKELFKK